MKYHVDHVVSNAYQHVLAGLILDESGRAYTTGIGSASKIPLSIGCCPELILSLIHVGNKQDDTSKKASDKRCLRLLYI